MTDEHVLPFAGTPEELEKYLLEFARLTGAVAGRHAADPSTPLGGSWLVSGGAMLSGNPNTAPWKLQLSRGADGLTIRTRIRTLPWSRAKAARLAAFRGSQLADYLTARVRGSGPEKFDVLRLREPFSPFGAGVAAATASFAWTVLTSLGAFAGAFVAAVLASLPLMSLS